MIDMQSLLLDPTYSVWGVPAVITTKAGAVIPCAVLDHRDGMNMVSARGRQTILVPGTSKEEGTVFVRCSECPTRPNDGTIVLGDEDATYKIRAAQQKGPKGTGEWQLSLEVIR
ncbi:MAG: hypothetical protein ACK4ZU_03970 [Allorhizobium sp.]